MMANFGKFEYEMASRMLSERKAKAENDAAERLSEVYERLPELREIDRALTSTVAKIGAITFSGVSKDERERELRQIEDDNFALQRKRAELLERAGYSADYTEPQYACRECKDTGFVENKSADSLTITECSCRKKALFVASCKASGLGDLLNRQTFETFSLSRVSDEPRIVRAYNVMHDYAEKFDGKSSTNLLLYGSTGLGKTHLSSAVAGVVIGRGYSVAYSTAINLKKHFEERDFGKQEPGEDISERYFSCDLLLIDDLGTELANSFVKQFLYELLDSRLNSGKSTIISTNLCGRELMQRYGQRVLSRLQGYFKTVMFEGIDKRLN